MTELTEEEKAAWRWATIPSVDQGASDVNKMIILADLSLRLLAALMEAEHDQLRPWELFPLCERCSWDSARWLEEARKELSGP